MNYYKRIQDAIDYIETNLYEDITPQQVANFACLSISHFYVIFQAMVGYSVKEYIRNRRLSNASLDLIHTKKRILDISLDYSFESQEAFSRAFKKMFDITPGKYRRSNSQKDLFYKANVLHNTKMKLQGGIKMQEKILLKDEFKVIGMEFLVNMQDALNNNALIKIYEEEFIPRCQEISNVANKKVLLNFIKNPTPDIIYCLNCFEVTDLISIPQGMVAIEVPTSKYAVFTHTGVMTPEIDNNIKKYVFGTWLPNSDYEWSEDYVINVFDDNEDSSQCLFHFYIPIK